MELNKQLVLRAKNQDPEAFSVLYKDVYKELYRFAYYTLQNQHDAEDAVSEAVLDAYRNIEKLRNPEAFKSWMFQIVSCKCKKKIKEYTKKYEEITENIPDRAYEPTDRTSVMQAMTVLSEEERLIVTMSVFGGYKGKEISSILHKKHSTVRSKYRRALEKLKRTLGCERNENGGLV